MIRQTLSYVAFVGALAGAAACGQQDTRPAGVEDRDPALGTGTGTGTGAGAAVQDAGDRMGAAVEHANIKTALTMDADLDAGEINVDSNHETRVITLKGTVPTAEQRARAETIAQREAGNYRVDNQLVVRATR